MGRYLVVFSLHGGMEARQVSAEDADAALKLAQKKVRYDWDVWEWEYVVFRLGDHKAVRCNVRDSIV